jgi:hypothetical protein
VEPRVTDQPAAGGASVATEAAVTAPGAAVAAAADPIAATIANALGQAEVAANRPDAATPAPATVDAGCAGRAVGGGTRSVTKRASSRGSAATRLGCAEVVTPVNLSAHSGLA